MRTVWFVSALACVTLVGATTSQAREYRIRCEGTQYVSGGDSYSYRATYYVDTRTGEWAEHSRFDDGSTHNNSGSGLRMNSDFISFGGLHIDRVSGRYHSTTYKLGVRHTNRGHCWGPLISRDRED